MRTNHTKKNSFYFVWSFLLNSNIQNHIEKGMNSMYDAIIIGAGVNGCAVARELYRKKLKIAVLEKCTDVCEGTSKANSGIVHAGFDAKPGTLMAKLNVIGSGRME